jgi:hypothetical protein
LITPQLSPPIDDKFTHNRNTLSAGPLKKHGASVTEIPEIYKLESPYLSQRDFDKNSHEISIDPDGMHIPSPPLPSFQVHPTAVSHSPDDMRVEHASQLNHSNDPSLAFACESYKQLI